MLNQLICGKVNQGEDLVPLKDVSISQLRRLAENSLCNRQGSRLPGIHPDQENNFVMLFGVLDVFVDRSRRLQPEE
jgi:hypothetical protein